MIYPKQPDPFSRDEIAGFIERGFLKIDQAFSAETARQCRDMLWAETPCDPDDAATWTQPVIRIGEMGQEPFRIAANSAVLQAAFDQLVGTGNWLPRETLGFFPIRFPGKEPAGDTGWHVDASFPGSDINDYMQWRINVRSRGRALLLLFLFSDVSENDAPTRIRVGSHLDVAKLLAPAGDEGLSFTELAAKIPGLPERPEIMATGKAGTVYLCHPFIVHAAQDHKGTHPKFMAQPPLLPKQEFSIDPAGNRIPPVVFAILKGLGG